MRPNLAFALKK